MATLAGELPGFRSRGEAGEASEAPTATVGEIVDELQAGRIVVIVDAEDRENEGDLVMLARSTDPQSINFMARYGRGLICLALSEELCRCLDLPLMTSRNRCTMATSFTVSIDASDGISTGISAADRSRTIRSAVRPGAGPGDLVKPGHVFPLMARPGGVLERAGHTEAACDLAVLAGAEPAAVVCEIMRDDGEMARLPDLMNFARTHSLKVGTIADLIAHRIETTSLVDPVSEQTDFRTPYGSFRLLAFRDVVTNATHVALVNGDVTPGRETLVRVHDDGFSTLDLLDMRAGGHTWSLGRALERIGKAECGVLVVLNSGHGPGHNVTGMRPPDDSPASPRDRSMIRGYGIGAQILRHLGVTRMRVLTTPRRMPNMAGFGLSVTGYITPEIGDSVCR